MGGEYRLSLGECLEYAQWMWDSNALLKLTDEADCVAGPNCAERTYRTWWNIWWRCKPHGICYVDCAWCGYRAGGYPQANAYYSFSGQPCGLIDPGSPFDHSLSFRGLCRWLEKQWLKLEARGCWKHFSEEPAGQALYDLLLWIAGLYDSLCIPRGCV